MARGGGNGLTPEALNELKGKALTALRARGKNSDTEGVLQLQPKGGLALFIAKQLKVSDYLANKISKALREDGVVEVKGQGPTKPRLILVQAEGEAKPAGGSRRSSSGTTRKRTSRRSGGRRSTGRRPGRPRKDAAATADEPPAAPPSHDDLVGQLKASYGALEAHNVELEATVASRDARIAELEGQLAQIRAIAG